MVFSLILPKILLIDKKAKHTSWVLKTWVLYKQQHDKPSKEEERELESREGEEEEEKKKEQAKKKSERIPTKKHQMIRSANSERMSFVLQGLIWV